MPGGLQASNASLAGLLYPGNQGSGQQRRQAPKRFAVSEGFSFAFFAGFFVLFHKRKVATF